MKCLVYVKFLPGGSIDPNCFFTRLNAEYSWLEEGESPSGSDGPQKSRSGICVAEYDSVEQISIDLSIMPGAGISNIEVVPISDDFDVKELFITGSQENQQLSLFR